MDVMDNLHTLTISDALEHIRGQKISARELVEACSRQIERLNPKLNVFITVMDQEDVVKASLSTSDGSASNTLRGIPVAIKDLFDMTGIRTTIGSKFLWKS
jgi:Asp-tRNA(Asn)/Glu-tRNA(Gln) amidotransferase A subunit family amidase